MDSLLPKSKICTKCGEEKLLGEFNKQPRGKYGKRPECKLCAKQYRRENKEKIAKRQKQYSQENKEKIKQYNEDNKEYKKEYAKQYREANKEKISAFFERQAERLKYLIENDLLPKSQVCTKCGESKLLEEFYKCKSSKYGRERHCKLCDKQRKQDNKEHIAKQRKQYREANREVIAERSKQYREENKEKMAERSKQYREENKEKLAERRKQRYQDNRELYIERTRQYRQDNKEKCLESCRQYHQKNKEKGNKNSREYYRNHQEQIKQYRQNNRERTNEYVKNRLKNDEQYRIRKYLSIGLWSALNKIGKRKNASILTYIGCNIEFMKEHLNSTKKPDWGDDLHIDHIIPSSLFDHTNEEEVKKCWNWRNLRYLPAQENMSKHNTLDMDLVKSYGIEDLLPEGVDK